MKPLVSVIVPVYDVESFLPECLNSLIGQSLKDIEIICVNDGSPDRSAEILEDYAGRDPRIQVLTQKNAGLSVARNTGMAAAKGKFLSFVDSDDCLKPTALEDLYNLCENKNLDHVIFAAQVFYDGADEEYAKWVSYYRHSHKYGEVKSGAECFADLVLNNDYVYAAQLRFSLRSRIVADKLLFRPGMIHEDNLFSFMNDLSAERAMVIDEMPYLFRKRSDSITTGAVSIKHPIGYLVAFLECLKFAAGKNFSSRVHQAIDKDLTRKYRAACRDLVKVENRNVKPEQWLQCKLAESLMPLIVDTPLPKDWRVKRTMLAVAKPVVSVIVPVYNVRPYLVQCLESLRAQTLKEIEIICVDDGSTDGSQHILSLYELLDTRIKVLHMPNAGGGAARNFGMRFAFGRYLAFADADDWLEPSLLEKLVEKAETEDSDLVVSRSKRFSVVEDKITRETSFSKHLLSLRGPFTAKEITREVFVELGNQPWAKLFRRSFVEERSLEFQELPRANDLRFVNLAKVLAKRISFLDFAGYIYREGVPNSSQSTNVASPTMFLDAWRSFRIMAEELGALDEGLRLSLADAVWDGVLFTLKRLDSKSQATVENELRRGLASELGLDSLTAETCRKKNWSALEDFLKRG